MLEKTSTGRPVAERPISECSIEKYLRIAKRRMRNRTGCVHRYPLLPRALFQRSCFQTQPDALRTIPSTFMVEGRIVKIIHQVILAD